MFRGEGRWGLVEQGIFNMANDNNNVDSIKGEAIGKSCSPIKDALSQHINEWYEKHEKKDASANENSIPTISENFPEIIEILKQPPAGCTPPFGCENAEMLG